MTRSRFTHVFVLLGVTLLVAGLASAGFANHTAADATVVLPAAFANTVATSVPRPTALAFTPDGRLLVTTQPGTLRVHVEGEPLKTVLDLGTWVCATSERGLLGVAVDPDFDDNGFVYLYYSRRTGATCDAGPKVNRVSRFVLTDAHAVDPASEVVLVDNIPSPGGTHNAGDLQFGKDGYLYVSVGDGGCDYAGDSGCNGANDAARDQHVLLGKILRITRDGGIPADNPFQSETSSRCNQTGRTETGRTCQETYAWGLRNPFRIAFDPGAASTRFHINDVGQAAWEEIDLGSAGADYGWNVREGPCARGSTSDCGAAPAGMTNPIYSYLHSSGCRAVTGGAFVPAGAWPSEYDGDYLYADYVCGKIFRLEPSAGGYSTTEFATGLGANSAVAMTFGPYGDSQALYYTSYAEGGQVRRIAFHRPASIAGFAPGSAAPGALVTLTGTEFTGATAVTLAQKPAAFDVESGTRMTVVVPAAAVSGRWRITTPAGTATSDGIFTVSPSVAGFAPGAGPPGASVALGGKGFMNASSVTLALKPVSFDVESDTRMNVVVPATGVSGRWRVTTPSGTAMSGGVFSVSPSITGFAPGGGAPGTTVTLGGTGFTSATSATLALKPATFTVQSATRISVVVPEGAQSGRWRVTTPAGTAASGGFFTVTAAARRAT